MTNRAEVMSMHITSDICDNTSSAEPGPVYDEEQNETMLHMRYAHAKTLQLRKSVWIFGAGGSEFAYSSSSKLDVMLCEHDRSV